MVNLMEMEIKMENNNLKKQFHQKVSAIRHFSFIYYDLSVYYKYFSNMLNIIYFLKNINYLYIVALFFFRDILKFIIILPCISKYSSNISK